MGIMSLKGNVDDILKKEKTLKELQTITELLANTGKLKRPDSLRSKVQALKSRFLSCPKK